MTQKRILQLAYHTALRKWAKEDTFARETGSKIARIKAERYWEECSELHEMILAEERREIEEAGE